MVFKSLKIRSLTKRLKAMQNFRLLNQPNDETLAKEIGYYHELAAIYKSLIGKKKYPFADVMVSACLRAAATLEDTKSQYDLGKKLLDEAKFRDKLQQEVLFASDNNEKQMKHLYEEALAYLQAAEKMGHVEAKRLHGLCYINGWGVEADKDKGFNLVVASIEQEQSWERVPQIFAEIGLNKPEFFSALTKKRDKS